MNKGESAQSGLGAQIEQVRSEAAKETARAMSPLEVGILLQQHEGQPETRGAHACAGPLGGISIGRCLARDSGAFARHQPHSAFNREQYDRCYCAAECNSGFVCSDGIQ